MKKIVARPSFFWLLYQITPIILVLNFPNFKLKLIITFDVIAVDNFYCYIWHQHSLLVKTLENEVNLSGNKIATHPHDKAFLGFPKRRILVAETKKCKVHI